MRVTIDRANEDDVLYTHPRQDKIRENLQSLQCQCRRRQNICKDARASMSYGVIRAELWFLSRSQLGWGLVAYSGYPKD